MKHISSHDNPTFKLVRALLESGRERRKSGLTVLDGVHLVQSYLDSGGRPHQIVLSEASLKDTEIEQLLGRYAGLEHVVLSDGLFREISSVETPTGILGVVAVPQSVSAPLSGSWVVLDAVQDAGNVGTIMRSALAAGCAATILLPGCAQPWSPKVLRAAMGAHFAMPVIEHKAPEVLFEGYAGKVITTRINAAKSLYDIDLSGPVAWLFGNEGAGLSPELESLAHDSIHIPMASGVESLNVAASAAVCLFETHRQRLKGTS